MPVVNVVVIIFAFVGLVAILYLLARCIAKWINWHQEASRDISELKGECKWLNERVTTLSQRIFEVGDKVHVEFKQ